MTGQLQVAIDAGQFLKADPGAARLLGVLSLQSLPRRLLARLPRPVRGGLRVRQRHRRREASGKAWRPPTTCACAAPAAVVLMEGEADIERETQDLRVVVVPEINAGTASLAYAFINPAIGLGTFLAQYFLRKPLAEASTREFRVTGPWDDPKVERVERTCSAVARGRGTGCGRRRRAAEDDDALGRGARHEDRRPADGVDAERRAQPRRGPHACWRRPPARAPSWRSCPSTSASWAEATATSSRWPKRPATDRSRRCSPRRRASTALARRRHLAAAKRRAKVAVLNANLRLLAGGRAGRALRQDPPVPLRQRPRAATTKAARSRPATTRSRSRRRACASA